MQAEIVDGATAVDPHTARSSSPAGTVRPGSAINAARRRASTSVSPTGVSQPGPCGMSVPGRSGRVTVAAVATGRLRRPKARIRATISTTETSPCSTSS